MKPLNKEILKLAVPSILANITVATVGMADIAIAGHIEGISLAGGGSGAAALIGGITIGSMIFDLLYWNFGFLRTGTGGLTAQAFGRGDKRESADILSRAVGISLISGVALIALQWILLNLVFMFLHCSPEVRLFASDYFFIRIWAAPATLSLLSFKGWFIGMQDGVNPMITDLIVNIVNIVASIALAMGVHIGDFSWEGIGYKGIALGTVIAQYCGLLFALIVIFARYRKRLFVGYSLSDAAGALKEKSGGEFFKLNIDLFIRSICFIIIYIGYTVIASNYGDMAIACSAIMMKLLLLFSYFTDGFAYAGEALTGKYIGMRDLPTTRKTVKYVFVWSFGFAAAFMIIYWFAGVPLLRIMTSDDVVVNECRQFLPWLMAMPLVGCAAFTWDGIYLGATAARPSRDSTLWAVVAFFITWFIGRAIWGPAASAAVSAAGASGYDVAIHILLCAYFMHLAARTVYLTIRYKKDIYVKPFQRS